MRFTKIAILTSEKSWFVPYAKEFVETLRTKDYQANLFFNHSDIGTNFEVIFILSYFRVVDKNFLKEHKHNLVVHESDLPKGRGWSPLFWQILEGKKKIPIVLFEAAEHVDEGNIYIKNYLNYRGDELHDEIREKQAQKTIELCLEFLEEYEKMKPKRQKGKATYYSKRKPDDSELDIDKTLREQFDSLRIANNEEFPAFFRYKGNKYILKIYKEIT